MTAIPPGLSPCRRHPCSREHADLVTSYRELRRLWQDQAEAVTGLYPGDLALYRERHPPPQFRTFLERGGWGERPPT